MKITKKLLGETKLLIYFIQTLICFTLRLTLFLYFRTRVIECGDVVTAVMFLPSFAYQGSHKLLATGLKFGSIKVWNTELGKIVIMLRLV